MISAKDQLYFERGHLIASGDKLYKTERASTWYYANVVPMWAKINKNNWKYLEDYIRKLVNHKNHSFETWAGGVGTLKLANKKSTCTTMMMSNHQ